MNEFSAKKLGEVLAFSQSGIEVFTRAKEALSELLSDEYQSTIDELTTQAGKIEDLATELECADITLQKAEKTKAKLIGMAETYIGDQWDDPAECMEWLGFFEGAAIVHWKLIEGISNKADNEKLSSLASDGVLLHRKVLTTVEEKIKSYGSEKFEQ